MKLVGVRHKGHTYIMRLYPEYDVAEEEPHMLDKVDEIYAPPTEGGTQIWVHIIRYLPKNKAIELRVRTLECDQFMYLKEDDETGG
jgi:hypothetical protein